MVVGFMEKYLYPKIKSTDSIRFMCNVDITYSKGLYYYNDGRVLSVEKVRGVYKACVRGREDYDVSLAFKDDTLVDYHCTCPAFYHYTGICKHIVATLLYMYNENEPIKLDCSNTQKNNSHENYKEKTPKLTNIQKSTSTEKNKQQTTISNKNNIEKQENDKNAVLEIYSNAFDYIRDKNNSEEEILKKYKEVVAIPIMEKENKYKAFLLNNVAYRCSDRNKKFEYLAQANILYPTSKNIAISALRVWCDIGNRNDFEKAMQIGERSLRPEINDEDDLEIRRLLGIVSEKMNAARKIDNGRNSENCKISGKKQNYFSRDVSEKIVHIILGVFVLAIWIGAAVGLTFAIEKEFSVIAFIISMILIPVVVAIIIKLFLLR